MFFTTLCSFYAAARVKLPSVIGDNMVLQQQSKVALWGRAEPNKVVVIQTSWDNKKYASVSDGAGTWRKEILTPQAGGPYTITFHDDVDLVVSNVMIGEVWFCAGQSNMEMPLRGFKNQPVANAEVILSQAENPQLRLFKTGRKASIIPLDSMQGNWAESSQLSASDFSAVAFIFGQMLQRKIQIPVGIILSAWGGTRIQSWMDLESLSSFPQDVNEFKLKADTSNEKHKIPSALFNGMIAPFLGYGIKGFIWYQGESNRHEPDRYKSLFPAMVSSWRKLWHADHKLPFYYVQIAPFQNKDTSRSGLALRMAQLNCMKLIPFSGMVCTLDIGSDTLIHPPNKIEVSERLLGYALKNDYGFPDMSASSPLYSFVKIDQQKALLFFDHADKGLTKNKDHLSLFEIAGSDKQFKPAMAFIRADNSIEVWRDDMPDPQWVRYAWKEFVEAELFSQDGLPVPSFTTE